MGPGRCMSSWAGSIRSLMIQKTTWVLMWIHWVSFSGICSCGIESADLHQGGKSSSLRVFPPSPPPPSHRASKILSTPYQNSTKPTNYQAQRISIGLCTLVDHLS